jgi:excinuclease ABC subunit A
VGTITEIYDYLRVLFARIGQQTCIKCHNPVGKGDAQGMVTRILKMPAGSKILILAPVIDGRKGEHREVIARLQRQGYARLRVNGVVQEIESVQALARYKKHTIEAVVDR